MEIMTESHFLQHAFLYVCAFLQMIFGWRSSVFEEQTITIIVSVLSLPLLTHSDVKWLVPFSVGVVLGSFLRNQTVLSVIYWSARQGCVTSEAEEVLSLKIITAAVGVA